MRCPRCGADSGVVNSRQGEHLTIRRQRKCFNGHVFHTTEMHNAAAVTATQRLKAHAVTVKKRVTLWARDKTIARRLHEGWIKLGAEFNIKRGAVYAAAKRGRK